MSPDIKYEIELMGEKDTLCQDFLLGGIVKENNDAGLKERQVWIDFAKGIGIILVVWAHTGGIFTSYINQFHMPLFFFISGYLYQYSGGG